MLAHLTVIDASTVLAGPSVGTFFAELGATVIKIENPLTPDVTRTWKLTTEDKLSDVSAYFASVNYNKQYKKLNLKDTENREEFLQLVAKADVLLTNFKKGDATKFHIEDELLFTINPRLIHGKISGYGSESSRVAYDLILQAETGFMSMNGTEESGPVKMPVALIDVLAAHQLKEGILLALLQAQHQQKGQVVEVALYDAAVCSLVNQASNYLMEGKIPQRIGSLHPNIAPYGEIFTTLDKDLITFAIGSDGHFVKLCHFLGLEYLPDDDRFTTNQLRVANRKELYLLLQDELEKMDTKAILEWAEEYNVPCGKIRNLEEVFKDNRAQGFIKEERINEIDTKRVSQLAFQIKPWK